MCYKLRAGYNNDVHDYNMFGRQWFGPGSQVGLSEEALSFEKLLRKRDYSRATELATRKISSVMDSTEHSFWTRQRLRGMRLQQRSDNDTLISVAFKGFWPGFRQDDNEVFNILQHAAAVIGAQIVHNNSEPDLLVFSCFGDPAFEQFPQATRFLYLGENVRPSFTNADYSMTFDTSSYCGRNVYLPLWLLRSTKYAAKVADYQAYEPEELEDPRAANEGDDSVVYVGNNSTANRIEAINELRKHGIRVDCFGSQSRPVENKLETLRKYQYTLCFENTYTPGYVTEKIVDSFLGGSYPIYWGGALPQIFNVEKFYVCDPFQSVATNMKNFLKWKRSNIRKCLPPLLNRGAFAKTDSSVVLFIARIFMDLF